ncbi:MAG: zinc ABC transporter substrate-binding protein [Helicobacteraceae bacterium]|jgi:zinc transport system substrate-binding protein|nr:zinc ABC transporter substrate-binding protein [Helicobacteraceae bacterium]
MFRSLLLAAFLSAFVHAKIVVAVSVAPQAWLAREIGGDLIEAFPIAPPSANAHTYEPKPAQMARLAKTSAYLACGVEFERIWLKRFEQNAPSMRVFHTDRNVTKLALTPLNREDRRGAIDSHIWFSPSAMRSQAGAIVEALGAVDPDNAEVYKKNGARALAKIDEIDREIASKLQPYKDRAFLIHHPALGYFANEYGLRQLFIEFESREPKPSEIAALIKTAKDEKINVVFVERGVPSKSAESLAIAINAKTEPITIISEEWGDLMRDAANSLIKAFDGGD